MISDSVLESVTRAILHKRALIDSNPAPRSIQIIVRLKSDGDGTRAVVLRAEWEFPGA